MALAAAAERTERIRLTSAVSVISSDDPVRVFQDFATLDLLSGGRAEIMAGRGSFIESFPLFGYDLDDYDELFAEKLELLLAVRAATEVSWEGRLRAPIDRRGVYPRPLQDPLPVWVAVGGSPQSAIRTGRLGLPMALAIIGGEPARFKPFAELHANAAAEAGAPRPALSINSHGFVAADLPGRRRHRLPGLRPDDGPDRPRARLAADEPRRLRGEPPASRAPTSSARRPRSPRRSSTSTRIFGHDRFMIQFSVGTLPHADVMRSIELFGTEVAPLVRRELAPAATVPEPYSSFSTESVLPAGSLNQAMSGPPAFITPFGSCGIPS